MSRTYRRRTATYDHWWVLSAEHVYWVWRSGVKPDREFPTIKPPNHEAGSKEGKRALARFHSDMHCTGRESSWIIRMKNHHVARREEQALYRWRKSPDMEVVLLPRVRNSEFW